VGTDFARANLRNAKLRHAELIGSNFQGADLHRSDFTGANLEGADFHRADLRDASVRDTKLCARSTSGGFQSGDSIGCADFRDADVRGADLRGALLCDGSHDKRCTPLDAATLLAHAGSDLAGAILP
jgi:uncharacterized protein YjbI with pentapeptide repeats